MFSWRRVGVLGVVVLLVGAAVSPVGASAGPRRMVTAQVATLATHVVQVAGTSVKGLAVDPGSGRLFVSVDGSLAVLDRDGAPVGSVAVPGLPVAGMGSIFTRSGGIIYRVDPVALTITGTWQAGSDTMVDPPGLMASGDYLRWSVQSFPPGVYDLMAFHPGTGSLSGSTGSVPLGASSGALLSLRAGGSLQFYTGGGASNEGYRRQTAYTDLTGLALSPTGGRAFAASPSAAVVHDFAIGSIDFTDLGIGYPFPGSFVRTVAGPSGGGAPQVQHTLLQVQSTSDSHQVVTVFRVGDEEPKATIDLGTGDAAKSALAFSPTGDRSYALAGRSTGTDPGATVTITDLPPEPPALPVRYVDVAGTNFKSLVVDPTTGRLFAHIDGSTQVFDSEGAYIKTLTGELFPVAAYGSVFTSGATGGIHRFDPATLELTGQWTSQYYSSPTSLGPAEDRLYWTFNDPFGNGYYTCRLLPATGATDCTKVTADLVGGAFGGNMRVVVEYPTPGSGGHLGLMRMGGAWAMGHSPTAYDRIDGLAIAADGSHAFVATPANASVHDFTIDFATFTESGAAYPFAGDFVSMALSQPSINLLAVDSRIGDNSIVTLFHRGDRPARASLDLLGPGRSGWSAGFSPDGSKLYGLVTKGSDDPPRIAIADLATTVGSPTPAIVGSAGGANVHVAVAGIGSAGVTVRGATVPSEVDGDGIGFTMPPLAEGPAAVVVTNGLGVTHRAADPLLVVDLGPFVDVPSFADRQYRDVLGRPPTDAETLATTAALAGGAKPAALIADLLRSRGLLTKDAALVRLYDAVFLRPPDTKGFTYWLNRMNNGTRLVNVAATFAGSGEFQRRYGSLSNGAFVDLIYHNVLDRGADSEGRNHWIRKLNDGTSRGTLVAQFSQGSEFVRKTTVDVERTLLVVAMFHRTPSATEIAGVAPGTDLADIAHGLLTSPNYPA